jgi:hypothetical protein
MYPSTITFISFVVPGTFRSGAVIFMMMNSNIKKVPIFKGLNEEG